MFKHVKLLFFLVLLSFSLLLYWGCDQPEDVLTPLTETNLWLQPEKLPDNPEGMVYELWVADATDTVSIERFGYDFARRKFLNVDGTDRVDSNQFHLNYDILTFTNILLSVELNPDDNSNSPGAIMLVDFTASQTIKMKFPKMDSLWSSTIWYSMESASDGMDSLTDGYSIWFCGYTEASRDFNDTLSIVEWAEIPETLDVEEVPDTGVVVFIGIDTVTIERRDTVRVYGLDSFPQSIIRFDSLLDTLFEAPFVNERLAIEFEVVPGTIVYDNFLMNNEDFGFPDLSEYGWKYKGWVVSPQIDSTAVNTRMTLPSWVIIGTALDETEGAMLTTGTFTNPCYPDDANPYVVSTRVPRVPGEDFLTNLPEGIPAVNLVPSRSGNPGRVFISLEPCNWNSDTTNFPLVAFIGELPEDRAAVTSGVALQQFYLRGWMQDESDPFYGFPWIRVNIERK
ncbi:MAG: hypothetical protein AB1483_08110 [Candidatus Zixiibacteriota bacterium]